MYCGKNPIWLMLSYCKGIRGTVLPAYLVPVYLVNRLSRQFFESPSPRHIEYIEKWSDISSTRYKKPAYLVKMSRSGSYIHIVYLIGYLVATKIWTKMVLCVNFISNGALFSSFIRRCSPHRWSFINKVKPFFFDILIVWSFAVMDPP